MKTNENLSIIMFLFLALAAIGSATESNDISDHMDTKKCICDLTSYSCDSYCCCDSDCEASVVQVWQDGEVCEAEKFTGYSRLFCSKQGKFFKESAEKDTIDPLFKLLCVQYNNAPDWGIYHELIDDSNSYSSDVVDKLIQENKYYPDTLFYEHPDRTTSYLKPGSKLRAQYSGSVSWQAFDSYWVLPGPSPSGQCSHSSTISWLNSQPSTSCQVPSPLESSCSAYLDTSSFYGYSVSSINSISSNNLTKITLNNIYKRGQNTDSVVTSAKTTFSNSKCMNAVVQADYRIISGDSQTVISKIEVDLYVQDVTASPVLQVSVKFFTSDAAKELSGNPGYVKGKPLITAYDNGSELKLNEKVQVFGADSYGICSNDNYFASPVPRYGQDTIITCGKNLTSTDFEKFCSKEQVSGMGIFKQDSWTHVAKFGNIQTTNSDDWVKISSSDMPDPSYSSGECTLPTVLVYDIIYTQIGPYSNPQDKIIKVQKHFKTSTWKIPTLSQVFLFGVSLNFIPYNSDFDPYTPDASASTLIPDEVIYSVQSLGSSLLPHFIILLFL